MPAPHSAPKQPLPLPHSVGPGTCMPASGTDAGRWPCGPQSRWLCAGQLRDGVPGWHQNVLNACLHEPIAPTFSEEGGAWGRAGSGPRADTPPAGPQNAQLPPPSLAACRSGRYPLPAVSVRSKKAMTTHSSGGREGEGSPGSGGTRVLKGARGRRREEERIKGKVLLGSFLTHTRTAEGFRGCGVWKTLLS